MTLNHLIFNPYEVNTYIISSGDGQCIIVDPACCSPDEQNILKKHITERALRPVMLINTHGHFDHVIGNAFVCRTWPDIKTVAHRDDLFLMQNAYRQGEIFGFAVEQPPEPTSFVCDEDTIAAGEDIRLTVRHIPGHSPGSIVIHSPSEKWVIAGDVLFRGSIGRSDLPGGDYDTLIAGIGKKLMVLPPETVVYPGHGEKTSLEREKNIIRS